MKFSSAPAPKAELLLVSTDANIASRLFWELSLSIANEEITTVTYEREDVRSSPYANLWAFLNSPPPGHLYSVEGLDPVRIINGLFDVLAAEYGGRIQIAEPWTIVEGIPLLVIGLDLPRWPRAGS
jgi:hypothetical protein